MTQTFKRAFLNESTIVMTFSARSTCAPQLVNTYVLLQGSLDEIEVVGHNIVETLSELLDRAIDDLIDEDVDTLFSLLERKLKSARRTARRSATGGPMQQ